MKTKTEVTKVVEVHSTFGDLSDTDIPRRMEELLETHAWAKISPAMPVYNKYGVELYFTITAGDYMDKFI